MRKTILFLVSLFLSVSLFSQYEYFNNTYEGLYTNVISVNNKIYCLGVVEGNTYMTGVRINGLGELENTTVQALNNAFVPQVGGAMNLKLDSQGFVHGTAENTADEASGAIYSYDIDFNVLWSFNVEYNNPDTISSEFHLAKELSMGIYGAGHKVFDYNDGAGDSYSNLLMVKLDIEGNLIWEREYNWSEITGGEYFLRVSQIHELPNEEILLCVSRYHDWDQLLIKMDADGNILDWYEWGGELNDWLSFAVVEEDGTAVVAYKESYDYFDDDPIYTISNLHLMKFNYELMEPIWDITYEIPLKLNWIHDLIQTSDGGYMLGGWVLIDEDDLPSVYQAGYILKTNGEGEFQWLKYYTHEDTTPEDVEAGEVHELYDMDNTSDGGVVACGRYWDFETPIAEAWVFKIDPCGDTQDLGCPQYTQVIDHEDLKNPQLQIYPNPSSNIVSIDFPLASFSNSYQLHIYNSKGQKIENKISTVLQAHQEMDVRNSAVGLYLVQVVDRNGTLVDTKRLVVE